MFKKPNTKLKIRALPKYHLKNCINKYIIHYYKISQFFNMFFKKEKYGTNKKNKNNQRKLKKKIKKN